MPLASFTSPISPFVLRPPNLLLLFLLVLLLLALTAHRLGYNPRCLTRDLHAAWTAYLRPSEIVRVINKCNQYNNTDNLGYTDSTNDLQCLDTDAEGGVGFHTAGHFGIGGIAMDPWASPQGSHFLFLAPSFIQI